MTIRGGEEGSGGSEKEEGGADIYRALIAWDGQDD